MKEKIKILFLIQIPPPYHGASLRNSELYESINNRKEFETRLIPMFFTKNIDELSFFSLKKVIISLKICLKLIHETRTFKPHIVFFSFSPNKWAFLRDLLFVEILKFFPVKKVFIIREQVKKSPIKQKIFSSISNNSTIIALSHNNKKMLEKNGFRNVIVINNGLKIEVNQEDLGRKRKNSTTTILFLSNLSKEKGVYVFLESLSILKNKGFTFKAEIVGASININKKELLENIKTLKIEDRVFYHSFANREKRYKFYLKSDIFVLPSLKETFPGVILEAMQCALPVISTKEGGIPDIVVDRETGFLVEKGNPSVLAEKIEILLKNKNLAKKMGKKGRERFLKNFTFEKMEEDFVKLFYSLVENDEN